MKIYKAKVSESAVRAFSKAVKATGDYSSTFDKGINCLERLMNQLNEYNNELGKCISSMEEAQDRLDTKIEEIKKKIHELEQELDQYNNELQSLEEELSCTPPTTEYVDENGESHEEDNPEYDRICNEKESLNTIIDEKTEEKNGHERRLDSAVSIHGKLDNQIRHAVEAVNELAEKINQCEQLQRELEELQDKNKIQSSAAADSLQKILEVIDKYLHIKMRYEMNSSAGWQFDPGRSDSAAVINKMSSSEEKPAWQVEIDKVPMEEIEKHQIKFDEFGHIAEYDGKTFGGKYNPYDVRLKRTSFNNPLFGRYEGGRGESKYIPSERTMDGINVKSILTKYGQDGIVYRNAEPDFEVCAEAVVKITSMTSNRYDYADEYGETKPGNFSQADEELAKTWRTEKKEGRIDWEAIDVKKYRAANRLTWHEKCDTETMVLVPFEINFYFKHSGGCSECAKRDGSIEDGGGFDE